MNIIIEHIEIKPVIFNKDTDFGYEISLNKQVKDILANIQLPASGLDLEPLDYTNTGLVIEQTTSLNEAMTKLSEAMARLSTTTSKLELLTLDTNNIFN